MRPILLLALLPAYAFPPAAPLEIVRPVVSQMEGGAPDTPGYQHVPGETVFFTCRVANYAKSPEQKIHVAYSVQAFDPKGVPLAELYKNEISDEVAPQDKEWMPKIATEVAIPPLAGSGAYKIVVKAEDLVAKTSAELSVPFEIRGREVEPSDKLVVRNFHFFRGEEAVQPLDKPAYKAGDGIWARFDIIGYKYGPPDNKIDISYVTSILGSAGSVLWTQKEPAVEQSESFYPKRYIAASWGIGTQGVKPGSYTLVVAVKDRIGSQTCEARQTFTVE